MKSAPSTSRRRVSADEALALWTEYKRTGSVQVRNRLVMTFAPLVKYIVFKKVRELGVLVHRHARVARAGEDGGGDVATAGGDHLRRARAGVPERGGDVVRHTGPAGRGAA